jgi:predicted DNA-binding protein YlxM (UPF0122 family)
MFKFIKKEAKIKPEDIRTLLLYANTPENLIFRSLWDQLYRENDKILKQQLRNKFSNILLEDIEELVDDAFLAFRMQLIKKGVFLQYPPNTLVGRRKFQYISQQRQLLKFIDCIETKGFTKYLFNLCNWMALDFLKTGSRAAMNITTIDTILQLANENELYQEFEVADIEPTFAVWWKKIENLLGPKLFPVFYDFTIEELSHQEIAEKHHISEESSRERKSRAERKLKTSNLMLQFKQYVSFKSVSIFFVIILF